MSILGYSASYFLPEYWASTPLYGEKIIPLIDYILSTDFVQADKLANAFYAMTDKYKNTADLPIEFIKEIINESGYTYVLDLLGEDEESIRLLTYLLVLIHQLKGTQLGIEVVLNLLRKTTNPMIFTLMGSLNLETNSYSGFSSNDYIFYRNFTVGDESFELVIPIRTGQFTDQQCIASIPNYGLYIGLDTQGHLVLSLGSKERNDWDIAKEENSTLLTLSPNTNYYLKLEYDGFKYYLKVSEDEGKRYTDYIVVDNRTPLELHAARVYLGVDATGDAIRQPFNGSVDIAPFAMDVQNVTIIEWFEQFPVEEDSENTFIVKVDLDLGLVSTNFFKNFAKFVSKYVYPELKAFEARLEFKNNITFIPYSRQKMTFVGSGDLDEQINNYMAQRQ